MNSSCVDPAASTVQPLKSCNQHVRKIRILLVAAILLLLLLSVSFFWRRDVRSSHSQASHADKMRRHDATAQVQLNVSSDTSQLPKLLPESTHASRDRLIQLFQERRSIQKQQSTELHERLAWNADESFQEARGDDQRISQEEKIRSMRMTGTNNLMPPPTLLHDTQEDSVLQGPQHQDYGSRSSPDELEYTAATHIQENRRILGHGNHPRRNSIYSSSRKLRNNSFATDDRGGRNQSFFHSQGNWTGDKPRRYGGGGYYRSGGGGGYPADPPNKQGPPKFSNCDDDGASSACSGYVDETSKSPSTIESLTYSPAMADPTPVPLSLAPFRDQPYPPPVSPPALPPLPPPVSPPISIPVAAPVAPPPLPGPPPAPAQPNSPSTISESPSPESYMPMFVIQAEPTLFPAPFHGSPFPSVTLPPAEIGTYIPTTTLTPTRTTNQLVPPPHFPVAASTSLSPTFSSSTLESFSPTVPSPSIHRVPAPPSSEGSPAPIVSVATQPPVIFSTGTMGPTIRSTGSAAPWTTSSSSPAPQPVSKNVGIRTTPNPSASGVTNNPSIGPSIIQLELKVLQNSSVPFNVSQHIVGVINNVLNSRTPFHAFPANFSFSRKTRGFSNSSILLVQDPNASDVTVQSVVSSTKSWKLYDVGYRCFYSSKNNTPIENATVLQEIRSICLRAVNASIVSGSFLRQLAAAANQSNVKVSNVSLPSGNTMSPSVTPSASPSTIPSMQPSTSPSTIPSMQPSASPSATPSATPSTLPSAVPSILPSSLPSDVPSMVPSLSPSVVPSANPSLARFLPGARTFPLPLSTKGLDVRWWMGLVIALATVGSTALLMLLGVQREEKLKKEELWGFPLATEQDVGNLLNLGFMWQQGEGHEGPPKGVIVFNKAKFGYRDEDSTLMGGFHDPQFVMNTAEVTLPSSGTSREQS